MNIAIREKEVRRSAFGKRRVIFTGDLLRPHDHGGQSGKQNGNIRMISRLLRTQIERATGLAPEVLLSGPDAFDPWNIYAAAGRPCSVDAWGEIYHRETATAHAEDYVHAHFGGALTIGFEMNAHILAMLDRIGAPYIDIVLHPVRFHDDIVFAFRSNAPEIRERLAQYLLPDDVFYARAGLIHAGLVFEKPAAPEDVRTIFMGQTKDDKTLIQNGRIVDFSRYADRIRAEFLKPGGRVGLKPHPLYHSDFGLTACGAPFHQIHVTRENFYRLVGSEHVETIVSVSSSTSLEARYFGKRGVHLGAYPFDFADGASALSDESYLAVEGAFLAPGFWSYVLGAGPVRSTPPEIGFKAPPNALRLALRAFWGYNEISSDIIADQRRA